MAKYQGPTEEEKAQMKAENEERKQEKQRAKLPQHRPVAEDAAAPKPEAKEKKSFVMTGKEVMALKVPPVQYLVDGILRIGRRRASLFNSQPESGKSTASVALAVAVAQGKPFLGRKTLRGEVLYWQTEDSPEDLQDSLRRLGYDPDKDCDILVFRGEPEDNTIDTLNKVLEEHPNVKLTIIETMNDLLDFEDNKTHEARRAYTDFNAKVVSKHYHRMAFLGLQHLKKHGTLKAGERISGSTEIRGRTDGKWYLEIKSDEDPRRIFYTQVRKGNNIPRTYLEYNKETEAVTLGLPLTEERKLSAEKTRERITTAILEYFSLHPDTTFKQDCFPVIDGNSTLKRKQFKELLASGRLVQTGEGTKTSPYVYRAVEFPMEERKEAA